MESVMSSPRFSVASLPTSFRLAAVCAAAGLALSLSACGPAVSQSGPPPATDVGVVTLAARSVVLQTELPGRTVAQRTAEIRPQISGLVQTRLFDEGAKVKAGQVLYQIDPGSYEATVRSNQAAVAKAQAALVVARQTAQRTKALLDAGAGTVQDDETAQSNLLQAEATLQSAQATLASAQLDLNRTRIAAPFAGRVDTSTVTAGALVTANQTTALTTVSQMDPMMVDIPQSSAEVLRLRQQVQSGQLKSSTLRIRLMLEDGSTYKHAGKLTVQGVTVNTATGAVTLRAEVPNPEGVLLPGMYVRAVLDQAEDPNALLAPQAGIARNTHGDATALVVEADGKVAERKVTVDQVIAGQWRVTSGLKAGERLIVEGANKVRAGQIVHAVAAGTAVADAAPAGKSADTAAR
jgi:membrane fusion protein, multidrug efflux system